MRFQFTKVVAIAVIALTAMGALPSTVGESPMAAPDEAAMRASLIEGAEWVMTVTDPTGQLSPPSGAPAMEVSSAGRMCLNGLALLRAYQVTGDERYMARAEACGDLALASIQAGTSYVIARTNVQPTDAGGGFPNAQPGKVDDSYQGSYTGAIRFNLWESLRGVMFLWEMYQETGETKYVNGVTLLDRLIGMEFYAGDDPLTGLVDFVTLDAGGVYNQGGITSTLEHAMGLTVVSTAGVELNFLWKDRYDLITYVRSLVKSDGSYDDKLTLPGQTDSSETKHVIMVPALYDLGRPREADDLTEWVLEQQQANGSFDCPHDADPHGDTAMAIMGLLPVGEVSAGGEALSWLISEQKTDGSWPYMPSNMPWPSSMYATQWSVLALYTGLTNYNLVLEPSGIETAVVWEGDPPKVMAFTVNVTVANEGLVPVTGATVRIFDGPKGGGNPVHDEATIDVPALGTSGASLEFRPAVRGPHEVHVWVEYAAGGEFQTRDNNVSVWVNLNREPTGTIASPEEGQLFPFGHPIEFQAADVVDLDGDEVSFTWTDSVEGLLSTQAGFTRVLEPGDHEVVLTFVDGNGPSTRANVSFSIRQNIAPTIRISIPADGARYFDYQSITFNASASSDAEDHTLHYTWESNVDGVLGWGAVISKRLSPGPHTITVWVDDTWANVSRTVSIHVIQTFPPDIVITKPLDGGVYVTTTRVDFDATGTTDQDSEILEFFWISNIDGLLSERPSFLAKLTVGHHIITLAVDDGNYNVTQVVEIDVLDNRAPVAAITSPPDDSTFDSDDVVELNGSTSFDLEDHLTYFWVSDRSGYLGNEPTLNIKLARGAHTITLWVDDDHGHNVSTSIILTVLNLGPTAGISAPEPGAVYQTGTNVLFMSASSFDPEGDKLFYEWFIRKEGDEWVTLGTQARVERSFASAGTYEVKLVVTDGKESDEAVISFQVRKADRTEDDGPGFGAFAAISGALLVAALSAGARRRRS